MRKPTIIVGAGAAGLACARVLQERGLPFLLLESSDRVGGRLATDQHEGFALDRGFQILLTSYQEVRRWVNLSELNLGTFKSGALIRHGRELLEFPDPLKQPLKLLQTLRCPVGTLADRLRIGHYLLRLFVDQFSRRQSRRPLSQYAPTLSEILNPLWHIRAQARRGNGLLPQAGTAMDRLGWLGFSQDFVARFLQPFLSGVLLDEELSAPARFLDFLFGRFAAGSAALPAGGIQRVAEALARPLPAESLRLRSRVARIAADEVTLEGGETLQAAEVVLAVDRSSAARLLNEPVEAGFRGTCCTYFAAPRSPLPAAYLALNPNRESAVHHVAVPSDVALGYAPPGQSLISVTHVGHPEIAAEDTLEELSGWLSTAGWRLLRRYVLPEALPVPSDGQARLRSSGLVVCGDHVAAPSLEWALRSGRRAGEEIAL